VIFFILKQAHQSFWAPFAQKWNTEHGAVFRHSTVTVFCFTKYRALSTDLSHGQNSKILWQVDEHWEFRIRRLCENFCLLECEIVKHDKSLTIFSGGEKKL